MGVPNKNVRLKYTHLHDFTGHGQFAPKGGCITFPLHMHFAPLMLPYRTEFIMVPLVDDGPVPAPENGAARDRICFMSGSGPIFPRLVCEHDQVSYDQQLRAIKSLG